MAESVSELRSEIEKLERKHGEHPEGRFFAPLADAYRKSGELEAAERVLRDGLQLHPEYLSAHVVLGRVLVERERLDEAAEEFRHVLSLDSQNLIALRMLGEIADRSGDVAAAEGWYRALLAADPMNEDARGGLERLASTSAELSTDTATEAPERAELALPDDEAPGGSPEADQAPVSSVAGDMDDNDDGGWRSPISVPDHFAAEVTEDAEPDEEVVTETIAELYLRQGFHERAAEVYRALIERRGEEPHLLEKLRDAEGRSGMALEEVSDPDSLESIDPFAASFAVGFEGRPGTLASDEGGDEGLAEVEDLTSGSWAIGGEPDKPVWDEFEPGPAGATLSESSATAGESQVDTVAVYLAGLLAWRPGSSPPAVSDREDADAAAEAWDVPLPWESSESHAADDSPAPRSEGVQPIEGDAASDFSFDRFFGESVAPETPPANVPPVYPEAPGEERDGQGEDEDEDLESFQAWLRSLRR
jgi:tetratricopeptide (TPR) repeat protein